MEDYRYDVAFSFLARDESIATGINDRLAERVKTFLYSRRQEDVAGTDGYETFGNVFERQARVVVVVLGDGWGERGFTLAEKTAIQNRAMKHGWDFLQVLAVDREVVVPSFIPKTHIYYDWSRWGIDGACGVIEAHVRREGGEARESTFEQAAAIKRQELEMQKARRQFRNLPHGLEWFALETAHLFREVMDLATRSSVGMRSQPAQGMVSVHAPGISMSVVAEQPYGNTIDHARVRSAFYDTSTGREGKCPKAEPDLVFEPGLERAGTPGWWGSERWFSTSQLADFLLRRMLRHVTV